MNFPKISLTVDQLKSAGRHVASVAAGAVIGAASLKLISGSDAASLQSSFDQISHGVTEVVTGVAALVAAAMTAYATISANPVVRLLRGLIEVKNDPAKMEQVRNSSLSDKANLIAVTDSLKEVEGVPLTPTKDGNAIADLVPSKSVDVSNS
jgi:hypothetical protein